MWHRTSSNTQNKEPETMELVSFPVFTRQSREVQRQNESVHQDPGPSRFDDNDAFWERILQTPSDEALGIGVDAGNMFSTGPVELVCGHMGSSSCLETLPSPARLMGRKKKRGGAERKDNAVAQHLIELRRKQSYIDSLKGDKWWSSSLWRTEQEWAEPEGEQAEPNGEIHPHLPDHFFSREIQHEYNEQMLDLTPGGNPMMSFVVGGTAHREVQRNWERPGTSHLEFWGIQYNSEE